MMIDHKQYLIVVSALNEEDGGGYLARVPDLPGCFGDGETREAATTDAEKAIVEWIDEYSRMGREIPHAGAVEEQLRASREAEIGFINHLRESLKEKEQDFDSLENRLSSIENDLQHLLEIAENNEAWERFHIITKSTRPRQLELPC